jgi:hypothetical protein
MEKQRNHIVLQCYGNEDIFYECAFALLSLSRVYQQQVDAAIWLYTDKPEWFGRFADCPLDLNFRKIDDEILKQWRGNINFVHRVKIEVLRDFARGHSGNVIYLDTDIVFTSALDHVWQQLTYGALYMHVCEGRVADGGNPMLVKLNKYLESKPHVRLSDKPLNQTFMWNAGVLGFNTTRKDLLDKVLEFTDAEYPGFPKHTMEQFAFSAVFSTAGAIKPAAGYIIHYWNLKEARILLREFFEQYKTQPWQQLCDQSVQLQIPVLMQEKINFYENRSIKDKLLKKRWIPTAPCRPLSA